MKSYSELITLPTWQDRIDYLFLGDNKIGEATFGGHRYLNQMFYKSPEWKQARREVIIRDNGCDMGLPDYPILNQTKIIIHHINPITIEDVLDRKKCVYDPDNLISVTFNTHQLIHFGTPTSKDICRLDGERSENDTILW